MTSDEEDVSYFSRAFETRWRGAGGGGRGGGGGGGVVVTVVLTS